MVKGVVAPLAQIRFHSVHFSISCICIVVCFCRYGADWCNLLFLSWHVWSITPALLLLSCSTRFNRYVSILVWLTNESVLVMYMKKRRSQWLILCVVMSIVKKVFPGSVQWPWVTMYWVLDVLLHPINGATIHRSKTLSMKMRCPKHNVTNRIPALQNALISTTIHTHLNL